MSVCFGLFSDLHASLPGAPTRGYSERTTKDMERGMSRFLAADARFAVSLGDILNRSETCEIQYDHLKDVISRWSRFGIPVHAVLGNHEFQQLSVADISELFQTDRTYYSFDLSGYRFIILDTCIRPDGVHYENDDFDWKEGILPAEQVQWLRSRLADGKPTVIFTHTNIYLDPSLNGWDHYLVQNYAEVLDILEESECVLAVFQGHRHTHHYTLHRGIRFINVSAPIMSPEYNEEDFPIVVLDGEKLTYNGRDL